MWILSCCFAAFRVSARTLDIVLMDLAFAAAASSVVIGQ
jgi:hypothetical protein